MPDADTVNVRYMVDDVEDSIAFYTEVLEFEILTNFAPAFADVKHGNDMYALVDRHVVASPDGRNRRQPN